MGRTNLHTVEAIEKTLTDLSATTSLTGDVKEAIAQIIFDLHVAPLLTGEQIADWLERDALEALRDPAPSGYEEDGYTVAERAAYIQRSLEASATRVRIAGDIRSGRHLPTETTTGLCLTERKTDLSFTELNNPNVTA